MIITAKKSILTFLIISFCFLVGCAKKTNAVDDSYSYDLGGDNSLDAYSFVKNELLPFADPEDAIHGGASSIFLSKTGGYYYKKVCFEEYTKDYETITFSGSNRNTSLILNNIDSKKVMWGAGFVSESDDYLAFNLFGSDEDSISYIIDRCDSSGKIISSIHTDLDGINVVFSPNLAMDKEGRIHLIRRIDYDVEYYVLDATGHVEYKETYKNYLFDGLIELPNGDVACALSPVNDGITTENVINAYDANLSQMRTIIKWDFSKYGEESHEKNPDTVAGGISCFNMYDDSRLVVAAYDGVYILDLKNCENTRIYEWVNHGISGSNVCSIKADEQQNVYLMYVDEDGINYLMLSPTTEEKPIKKILFAVSEVNKKKYMNAVAKFNKKHPQYIISMKTYRYEDKNRLTAQMTAGDGAVLIDSSVVGFTQFEKLWESLDDCYEKNGWSSFEESVINLGRIEGKLCGAITDFYITSAFLDGNVEVLDYDSFTQIIKNYSGEKNIFNFDGEYAVEEVVLGLLSHTVEDSFYFSEGCFEPEKFEEAVRFAEEYVQNEKEPNYYNIEKASAFYNEVYISNPGELELNRLKYGADIKYVGLPGKLGGLNYINVSTPLCVRNNASSEEKELAKAFIEFLLSYDMGMSFASSFDFGFSVRKDVLNEQIECIEEYLEDELLGSGINANSILKELDKEQCRDELRSLIESAQTTQEKNYGYRYIISEELEAYLDGAQTMDIMLDHLRSRVNLYLQEKE